jgi:hypothetical protein
LLTSCVLPTTGLSALLDVRPAVFLACTMESLRLGRRKPRISGVAGGCDTSGTPGTAGTARTASHSRRGSARSAAMASDGASRRAVGHLQLRKRRPAGVGGGNIGTGGAYVALGAGVLA